MLALLILIHTHMYANAQKPTCLMNSGDATDIGKEEESATGGLLGDRVGDIVGGRVSALFRDTSLDKW